MCHEVLDMPVGWPILVYYGNLCYKDLYVIYFLHYVDDGQEKANEEAPENNPLYRTIYVGNLAPEVSTI